MLAGIDVSAIGQGMAFDWEAWRGKIAWAGIKISEGTSFADPAAARNIAGARSIGAKVVGYHFLHAGDSAEWQAAWFGHCAQRAALERGDAFAADVEQGGLDGGTPGRLWEVASGFASSIHGHYGCWPWTYTDRSLAVVAPNEVGASPLWLANPGGTPVTAIGPWKLITAEQTGQRGVDTDQFYGDLAQFDRLAYPRLTAPVPVVPPAPRPPVPVVPPAPTKADAVAAVRAIIAAAGVLDRYAAE